MIQARAVVADYASLIRPTIYFRPGICVAFNEWS